MRVTPKTKTKRRSPSSVQRSADRAAAHKTHKGQQSAPPQQQLRRSAPVFTMPVPHAPNSVQPAAGHATAEESERVEGRIDALQKKKARTEESLRLVPSPQPDPAPSDQIRRWPASRQEWQVEVDVSGQMIVEAWERGERGGANFEAECRTLDSLAGAGYSRGLLRECDLRARRSDGG